MPHNSNSLKWRHKARCQWRVRSRSCFLAVLYTQTGTESWGKSTLCPLREQHPPSCTDHTEHWEQRHERFVMRSHGMASEGSELRTKSAKPTLLNMKQNPWGLTTQTDWQQALEEIKRTFKHCLAGAGSWSPPGMVHSQSTGTELQ